MEQTMDAIARQGVAATALKGAAPLSGPTTPQGEPLFGAEPKPYLYSSGRERQTAPFPEARESVFSDSEQAELKVVKEFFFGQNSNPDSNIALGLQTGYISGRSVYHISFDNPYEIGGHGESELEWPLNNSLIGLGLDLNYKGTINNPTIPNRSGFRFSWFTKLDKRTGDMKDSDWIENDVGYIDYDDDGILNGSDPWAWNNDGLDIFSESPAELEYCNIIDMNYNYNFLVNDFGALGLLLGYYYQNFRFAVYSLDEYGYGPYATYDSITYRDTQNLKWGTYEISCQVPYIGASGELTWQDKLSLFLSFGYSGWAFLKDQDTHLYPTAVGGDIDMISKGKANDAQVYLANAKGSWRLTPRWLLSLGATYVFIEVDKTIVQNMYFDGINVSSSDPISERVKSEYWMANLSLKYVF